MARFDDSDSRTYVTGRRFVRRSADEPVVNITSVGINPASDIRIEDDGTVRVLSASPTNLPSRVSPSQITDGDSSVTRLWAPTDIVSAIIQHTPSGDDLQLDNNIFAGSVSGNTLTLNRFVNEEAGNPL